MLRVAIALLALAATLAAQSLTPRDEEFARRPLDEWARRLDDAGVWWAPVSSPADVLRDPQVLANEGLVEVPNPGGAGTTSSVNGPVSFRGRPLRRTGPAPRLGEHPDAHF